MDTHFFVRRCQLPWALFFETSLDETLLRRALAEVLKTNPLTAGRLRTQGGDPTAMPGGEECQFFVVCNNAGATFSVVESTATLRDITAQVPPIRSTLATSFQLLSIACMPGDLPPYSLGLNQADATNVSSADNDNLRRKVNDLPVSILSLPKAARLQEKGVCSFLSWRSSHASASLTVPPSLPLSLPLCISQPFLEMMDMDAVLSGAATLLSVRLVRAQRPTTTSRHLPHSLPFKSHPPKCRRGPAAV